MRSAEINLPNPLLRMAQASILPAQAKNRNVVGIIEFLKLTCIRARLNYVMSQEENLKV